MSDRLLDDLRNATNPGPRRPRSEEPAPPEKTHGIELALPPDPAPIVKTCVRHGNPIVRTGRCRECMSEDMQRAHAAKRARKEAEAIKEFKANPVKAALKKMGIPTPEAAKAPRPARTRKAKNTAEAGRAFFKNFNALEEEAIAALGRMRVPVEKPESKSFFPISGLKIDMLDNLVNRAKSEPADLPECKELAVKILFG